MRHARGIVGVAVLLLAALAGTGCNADRIQMENQQKKLAELEREKLDLQNRLAAALRDAQAARDRAAALQAQLDAAGRSPTPVQDDGIWKFKDGIAWTDIAEDILFDSGKADLKSSGRAKLQDVVSQIQQKFPDKAILVIGHTDTDPIKHSAKVWKDNLHLSQWRGRVVALEMMAMGLDARKMIAGGQGEFNPIAANDTKSNKQLNRRVQIVAVNPPTMAPGEASASPADAGGARADQ